MRIHMYMGPVRFVSDAKGPLEAKPKRFVVALAPSHEEALSKARAQFVDKARVGVTLEYGAPGQLPDTIALESLVYS